MVIFLYCKSFSYKKKKTSQSDFSIGCGAQVASGATPEIGGQKIALIFHQGMYFPLEFHINQDFNFCFNFFVLFG
jgi:hypothetical protein